jgi:signal transduction histidine kinase
MRQFGGQVEIRSTDNGTAVSASIPLRGKVSEAV